MKVLVFKDIKNNRWTLWSLDRKSHLGYRKTLSLKNCEFVVLEEKRKMVVKNNQRFPHAWVIGEITTKVKANKNVTYNPFKNKTFMQGKRKVLKSKKAIFDPQGQVFI